MPLAPRTVALAASEPGRAASELQGAAVATEAEGLRLHLSNSNSTGYRGVHERSGRFRAQHRVNGRIVNLGYFDMAVEAAVAYVRAVGEFQPPTQPPPSVAAEAEGVRLHLSSSSSTGYLGVWEEASGRFRAQHRVDGRHAGLGSFHTAVEAAVAVARAISEASAVASSASESAPPSASADETVLCARTQERGGGAIGCVLPAGHAGPHSFTLQGKRARCVKRPFDPTDVEAEESGEGASTQAGDDSESEVEATAGMAAPAGSEATSSQEAPVAEAEGLCLHPSSSSSTGYRGVWRHSSGRFVARHRVNDSKVFLGVFDTAVEAAVAYARAVGEYQPPAVAAEAEGLRLHLSSRSSTGYKNVSEHASGRFRALHYVGGKPVFLGIFGTAVEAAVAYARAVGQAPAAGEAGPSAAAASEASDSGEGEPGGAGGEAAAAESSSDTGEGSSEQEAVSCLWVACDRCDKWRRLPSGMPGQLPAEWFCWMHPDPACRVCEAPEEELGLGRAPAERQAAAVVAEAEGLRLHLSSNSSGYKGVFKESSGRFHARRRVDGKDVHIGRYDTVVEAAVAYAKAIGQAPVAGQTGPSAVAAAAGEASDSDEGEPACDGGEAAAAEGSSNTGRAPAERQEAAVATEAEGLRLHLSNGSTGYKGVYEQFGRFQAKRKVGGRLAHLGTFGTAVEAAVAYARTIGEYQPPSQPSSAEGVAPRHVQVLEEEADDEDDVAARAESEAGSGEARAVGEVEEEMEVEAPAAEAEGLRLHLSSNSTGYRGVFKQSSGRFHARRRVDGRNVSVGTFDTAVEAAVAYARAVGEYQPLAVATEAEGLRLHLSSSSSSGYLGVVEHTAGRFKAQRKVGGRNVFLGTFDTAVEAAVAYARAVGKAEPAAAGGRAVREKRVRGATDTGQSARRGGGGGVGGGSGGGGGGGGSGGGGALSSSSDAAPSPPEQQPGVVGEEGEDDEVEVEVEQEESEEEKEEEEEAMSDDGLEEVAPPPQSSAAAVPLLEGGDVQISAASGASELVNSQCEMILTYPLPCLHRTGLLPEHLPHQRALCPLHPFHASERPVAAPVDGNEVACPNCYCFACDAPVSACRHWRGGDAPAHCNAHSGSALWRQKRINAKRQRTRTVRAAQASVDPQLAQPSRSGLRSGLG